VQTSGMPLRRLSHWPLKAKLWAETDTLTSTMTTNVSTSESGHAQKPYLEFPVERNGRVYEGGSPGADRIVIGSIADDYSSAMYCAVITHDNSRHNGFTECQDDTLNLRGKGKFLPIITAESALPQRNLIQTIAL
jgi:ribonuclease